MFRVFTNAELSAIIHRVLASWCSRLARQPVTLEVDGSSPFEVAKRNAIRLDGVFFLHTFVFRQLLAASRNSRSAGTLAALPGGKFQLEDMEIDYDRRLVTISGTPIKLTQTEYNILAFLSEHTGKVLTYSAIISNIWGRMDDGSIKKLQVNMANIRKKLGCKPGDNRYIINELGIGYRIQDS